MKLAEALVLRADNQRRLEQLKQRLIRNAKVQEGDNPAENPVELVEEINRVAHEVMLLVQRINRTNATTTLDDGMHISDALAARDTLALRQSVYRELAQTASVVQDRFTRSEIKFRSTVDIAEVQKEADRLANEYRALDSRIQQHNWITDLME